MISAGSVSSAKSVASRDRKHVRRASVKALETVIKRRLSQNVLIDPSITPNEKGKEGSLKIRANEDEIEFQVIEELEKKGMLEAADQFAEKSLIRQKKSARIGKMSDLQIYVESVVSSHIFSNFILFIILLNTILISLQTSTDFTDAVGYYLSLIDNIFLGIYIAEIGLKFYAIRMHFFESEWNNFDFVIVFISLIEYILIYGFQFINSDSAVDTSIFRVFRVFKTFRALRALRILRTISFLQNLQMLVTTLFKSIPAMSSIIGLLVLFLYIFAIIGVEQFGGLFPKRFGRLDLAMFTLFQVITLDDWFQIIHDSQDVWRTSEEMYYGLFLFLFIFILSQTFIFINLFIAVIVNNLEQQMAAQERKETRETINAERRDSRSTRRVRKDTNASTTSMRSIASSIDSLDIDVHEDTNLKDIVGFNQAPAQQKTLLRNYFRLLASLDSHSSRYNMHLKTLDDLVDVVEQRDFMDSGATDEQE
eukprot:g2174.t1